MPDEVFEGINSLCVVRQELAALRVLMTSELQGTFPDQPTVGVWLRVVCVCWVCIQAFKHACMHACARACRVICGVSSVASCFAGNCAQAMFEHPLSQLPNLERECDKVSWVRGVEW